MYFLHQSNCIPLPPPPHRALYHLYWTDDLKTGTLKGTDEYGNKYFENNKYFTGRNRFGIQLSNWKKYNSQSFHHEGNKMFVYRWIIYNPKHGVDFDASMVPAIW